MQVPSRIRYFALQKPDTRQPRPAPLRGARSASISICNSTFSASSMRCRALIRAQIAKWATRYGDLLTLGVALAPCVVGYAEIAVRLAARPGVCVATNPYRVWIEEYAGAAYQEVAAKARAHLDRLANLYVTPAREAELVTIFKEATRTRDRLLGNGLARGATW